jgi:hypothetical protein
VSHSAHIRHLFHRKKKERRTAISLPKPSTESDQAQVTTVLTTFGLTIGAQELVPRLTRAGHLAAVPVLADVFDAKAEARRQRRIAR